MPLKMDKGIIKIRWDKLDFLELTLSDNGKGMTEETAINLLNTHSSNEKAGE